MAPQNNAIEDAAVRIGAFINKMANNRKMLSIDPDYEFDIHGFSNVKVDENSFNWLDDRTVLFHAKATAHQTDPASKISAIASVSFNGIAFFAEDMYHDMVLCKVELNNLKLLSNE